MAKLKDEEIISRMLQAIIGIDLHLTKLRRLRKQFRRLPEERRELILEKMSTVFGKFDATHDGLEVEHSEAGQPMLKKELPPLPSDFGNTLRDFLLGGMAFMVGRRIAQQRLEDLNSPEGEFDWPESLLDDD